MKPLTARAERMFDRKSVIGFPFQVGERVYILPDYTDYQTNLTEKMCGAVEIAPDTLGYETGKLDCNKKMIYDG